MEKALTKARALAHKEEAKQTAGRRHAPLIAQRITAVPQVQPPQELFNSCMKAVRRVRTRADIKNENDAASNLVSSCPQPCSRIPVVYLSGTTLRFAYVQRD